METSSFLEHVLLNALKRRAKGLFDFARETDGLQLTVRPSDPALPTLRVADLRADEQGLGGSLRLDIRQPVETTIFDGFHLALTDFDVALQNGAFSRSRLAGRLRLPYFEVELDVELGVRSDGFSLALAPRQSDPRRLTADGKVQLDIPLPGDVKLTLIVDALSIGVFGQARKLKLSGVLKLGVRGLSLPAVAFKGLWIDSRGRVELEGGWIDLPEQTALDFFGFHLELKRLGIGRDESGKRFIGLNGEMHLVEGLPLGGSVRGLTLNLDSGELSFDGVAVDFTVPGALRFAGTINFLQAPTPEAVVRAGLPEPMKQFAPFNVFFGEVRVELLAIPGLSFDARLAVGNFHGVSSFFLAFDVGLPPPGIVLFPGISLFALEGLFAAGFRPDPRRDGHTFWEWYKFGALFDERVEDYTAAEPRKWLPYFSSGALAFGAGGSIGTSDNGFAASAGVALTLIFPGPVIALSGRAKLLSTRSTRPSEYEILRLNAMATYDARAETFDLNVDARYDIAGLINIEGNAAVHADKSGNWYVALGLPPREKRIRARVLDIFESNAYFVTGPQGIVFGSYAGFDGEFKFGPFAVGFHCFVATIGAVQWSPLQFGGGVELHGEIHVSAFGVGIGLAVDELLEATAPHPFWIHGALEVTLELPWPLPDLHAGIDLEWGGDGPPPPLPSDAVRVEGTLADHYGIRDSYALPSVVTDNVGVVPDPPTRQENDFTPFPPLLPQDARLTLRFPRPTADEAGFPGWNKNGDTETAAASLPAGLPADDLSKLNLNPRVQWVYRRTLLSVELFRQAPGGLQLVAAQPSVAGVPGLPGNWVTGDNTFPLGDDGGVDDTTLRILAPGTGVFPPAPALYALKVVTKVEARRTTENDSQAGRQTAEWFYFQTSGGPGLVRAFKQRTELTVADERVRPPFPALAATGRAPAVSPWSGPLLDLRSYVQWAYPENGAAAAYFGYDISLEFNEPYVHEMYRALGRGEAGESLHFRCIDRNRRHVMLDPTAVGFSFLPLFDALITEPLKLRMRPDQEALVPLREQWPEDFLPRTRYTLDLVPGPSNFDGFCLRAASPEDSLAALTDFHDDEEKLPTLLRCEFTTSKYRTFPAQLSHAEQATNRIYLAAGDVPTQALRERQTLQEPYAAKQAELAGLVRQVAAVAADPIALTPLKAKLRQKRAETEHAWNTLFTGVARLFDRLVRTLGRPDLAGDQYAPLPPETELSVFESADGGFPALLLESPEPLPWRRIAVTAEGDNPVLICWNQDGTRALLMKERGFRPADRIELVFRGNLGAEVPCITRCGEAVTETVGLSLRVEGFVPTAGDMTRRRNGHTATRLNNGQVLLTGGAVTATDHFTAAEIYDPASDKFSAVGNLNLGRLRHTATLLPDGKVLIVGGETDLETTATAELYDPATGTFTFTGRMNVTRRMHTATLLPDGLVLIAGGIEIKGGTGFPLNSAELYDPTTGTFRPTGSLNIARERHTATLLPDGQVLLASGFIAAAAVSELYDPATETFHATGVMNQQRFNHTAVLLPDGMVLLAGGTNPGDFSVLASAEIYDPAAGIFRPTGNLTSPRSLHAAALLPEGQVLLAGGFNCGGPQCAVPVAVESAEIYQVEAGRFTVAANLHSPRSVFTATSLTAGNILLAGGNTIAAPRKTAEVYHH